MKAERVPEPDSRVITEIAELPASSAPQDAKDTTTADTKNSPTNARENPWLHFFIIFILQL
ncbi:hypothetical protein FACS1894125_0410 [Actinomycetota bacterium]|nr:hypothetical protein FACS1894125_0410 [Actinomycetota bacterium]